ncbi:DUF4224 domain-containing protein [Microbulbifer sp. 2205BS26-8]|uniref:DUF4224 domain-containing protein n=1 Tax=Microbulbifer sp. 2205BS26-8 TaxID=3064386 RepID=UPI00273FE463|nr:DUF4224 domain-containing protein [Microbulbifer sp. 2205BS26-8]MDP5208247.1 DUF4224 domain-containing protein [Microbulbifer sp. 2205BS26-8]
MNEILTETQLRRLTGAQSPDAQKRVLKDNQIPYVRRKDGKPVVTWEMVNQSQLTYKNRFNSKGASLQLPPGINMGAANG